MNGEQIKLIRRSLEKISAEEFAKDFYKRLFSMQPALQLLLPDDFGEQQEKLMPMLGAAVEMLDEREKLVPFLEETGCRLALCGVRAEHYEIIGTALLASLREAVGAEFTGETEAVWTQFYKLMSETMKHGARRLSVAPEQRQEKNTEEKINMKNYIQYIWACILTVILTAATNSAAPVVRQVQGQNATAILNTVNLFRADLGGSNNGVGSSYRSGRREINWDDVPDNLAAPNFLPANHFNSTSPRGAVFSTLCNGFSVERFRVSARAGNPTNTPVRFGDIDPSYATAFNTFSSERLFAVRGSCNTLTVTFFIPGTNIPATVSGFGMVFTNVQVSPSAQIIVYEAAGNMLPSGNIGVTPSQAGGLSFAGISYNGGERIARVDIIAGREALAAGNTGQIVAMDDFIYGEPRAAQYHENDFDGDGFADPSVFRPSTGTFYILNTGNNTTSFIPFGANGDVPVSGDFDGDQRADVAIFRPSVGEWWINRSSNGTTVAAQFGQNGDKPTPGDFDKDGRTDIAFWRPSNGNYFVLRSSNSSFFSFQWGQNGDIPVGAAVSP